MKHFIYTYREEKKRGGIHKTVRIYRILRGSPVFIGQATDTYVSEFQLVMETMGTLQLLPRKAFVTSPNTGGHVYCTPHLLREAGIASIYRVL